MCGDGTWQKIQASSGVNKIISGSDNVHISPSTGTGDVTLSVDETQSIIENVDTTTGLNLDEQTKTLSLNHATTDNLGTVKPDNDSIIISDSGVISAVGGGSGLDVQGGQGIEVTKQGNIATISSKIGTNSDLGIVKADGVSTFIDPDGTISSKTSLPDIQATDGLNIKYGTGHNLPDGYTELAYVRGKAQAYLDTGIRADYTTAYELKVAKLAVPSEYFNVFGACKAVSSGLNIALVQFLNASHSIKASWGNNTNTYIATLTNSYFDKIVCYGDANKRIVTNEETHETVTNELSYTEQWDTTKTYYIGKINGVSSGADFTGRIYYVKIWKDGSLVRHYIPAKENDTQKIGFYDIINNTFNPSSSAAQFIEGPDIIPTTILSMEKFQGATDTQNGIIGGVPAPTIEETNKFLCGNGTWSDDFTPSKLGAECFANLGDVQIGEKEDVALNPYTAKQVYEPKTYTLEIFYPSQTTVEGTVIDDIKASPNSKIILHLEGGSNLFILHLSSYTADIAYFHGIDWGYNEMLECKLDRTESNLAQITLTLHAI